MQYFSGITGDGETPRSPNEVRYVTRWSRPKGISHTALATKLNEPRWDALRDHCVRLPRCCVSEVRCLQRDAFVTDIFY
jgi:hypothetical protein